ncbi:MAG: rRNA maturation RNAse YbeY [Saprospiraceae bacterium]
MADNARSLDQPLGRELRRVLAHGVLHLCGYGDAGPEEKALMRSKEDYWIQQADALNI